jgi:hypothetical protein
MVACSSTITWWLVGDLSEDVLSPDNVIKPPDVAGSTEARIGVLSTIVLLGTVIVLAASTARIRRRSLLALLPLLAVGVFAAFALRVFTARVSGANIGAGLLVLFAVPFVPSMMLLSSWILRHPRPPSRGPQR